MRVGVRVQASVHAEIGACMLGFLGCWVARSPGFLGCYGSCACVWGCVCKQACMQTLVPACLDSWVAGLLGLLGSWVAMVTLDSWVAGLLDCWVAGFLGCWVARSPGFLCS